MVVQSNTANTRRLAKAGLVLAQRRRRWANINPALVQRIVFDGNEPDYYVRTAATE